MHTRRLALIGLALVTSTMAFASAANGLLSHGSPQETQLDRACSAGADSIDRVLAHAATAQVQTIESRLIVVTPGKLTGRIAFNRAGKTITVAGDPGSSSHSGFGCAQGRAGRHGLGPGQSRVVSTLTETFTMPGSYTLVFKLNQVGRGLLAQLAVADRAYQKQHPHGHHAPSLAFGIGLTYETTG